MKKFWLKTWRHLMALTICVLILVFTYFKETDAFLRAFTSGKIFGQKVSFFARFFFMDPEPAGYLLPEMAGYPNAFPGLGAVDLNAFWPDLADWFKLLFKKGQFLVWLEGILDGFSGFARGMMLLLMALIFVVVIFQGYFDENKYIWSRQSAPLKGWLWFRDQPLSAFNNWVIEYAKWFYRSPYLWFVATIVFFDLRMVSLILDVVGEYFYFFASFSVISLLDVVFAMLVSFIKAFSFLTPFGWGILIYILFRVYSYRQARMFIEGRLIPHDEAMVNADTGVFTLILGKMRGGKTTLATAFARIVNTIYHKNAYDNMNRVSLMFPEFPYQPFERDIVRLAGKRRIVNMQQAAAFAYRLYEKSLQNPRILYGYNVDKSRSVFYDGAVNIGIADALAIYAESYWIYVHAGNLIASNYPIRTDDFRLDKGHLVLWDSNYFKRKNKHLGDFSWLSHILIWDMLRFGKKVDENNKYKDAAGPMVAVATEFGKEYGNMISNSVYSAVDDTANPKNDFLDYSLKLGGHLANIWHTNFFKMIADEQRSGSLSSNLVNVAQTIFTADPKNQREKIALHLWWVEPLILEWVIKLRDKFYSKYRFNREDQTLMLLLIDSLASLAYQRLSYVYNRFGYKEFNLPNCTADSSGNLIEGEIEKFYIINYVDFSYRFESACMKDFLNAKKSDAIRGFFDIPTYKGIMPTKEEWELQGSYVVSDLEDPTRRLNLKKATKMRNGSRRSVSADRSARGGEGGK